MKSFASALILFPLITAGCAHSDPPHKRSHHASHRSHHQSNGTSTPDSDDSQDTPVTRTSPQDAGATNRALGESARDSMGNPAIGDY